MSDTDKNENFFPEKWLKKLPTGFIEEAEALDDEGLKKIVFTSESNIYTIDKEKESDIKLNAAKDLAKEMSAPYREATNSQTAKIKYALWLLEGRGISLDSKDD